VCGVRARARECVLRCVRCTSGRASLCFELVLAPIVLHARLVDRLVPWQLGLMEQHL
jgi:hypothetical protein